MINSAKYVLAFLISLLFFHNCTSPMAGSGSQTTNGIVLTVRENSISGVAGPGVTVELFSNTYSPFKNYGYRSHKLVGSDSVFAFRELDPDTAYNLLVLSKDSLRGLFVSGVLPGVDNAEFQDQKFEFTPTAQVFGSLVNIPTDREHEEYSIYIPGSPFLANVDSEQKYRIDNIPFGKYQLKAMVTSWESIGEEGVSIDVEIENINTGVDIDLSQVE